MARFYNDYKYKNLIIETPLITISIIVWFVYRVLDLYLWFHYLIIWLLNHNSTGLVAPELVEIVRSVVFKSLWFTWPLLVMDVFWMF